MPSPILTPIGSDSFNYSNQEPLPAASWGLITGSSDLQVLSHSAASTAVNSGRQYYLTSAPNDQYSSFTIGAFVNNSSFSAYIRTNAPASLNAGYNINVGISAGLANLSLISFLTGQIASAFNLPVTVGDTFTCAAIGTTIYALKNGAVLASVTNTAYATGSTVLSVSRWSVTSDSLVSNFTMGSAALGYSISGNAGVAGATVSWSGTASGSTVSDVTGHYSTPSLAPGTYTVTPSLTGVVFSPTSQTETVSNTDITGVNFSVLSYYSVPDCRVNKPNAATSRVLNGTLVYDVQTSSNAAIPPADDRVTKPTASGIYPTNSRTPGTYGPGE